MFGIFGKGRGFLPRVDIGSRRDDVFEGTQRNEIFIGRKGDDTVEMQGSVRDASVFGFGPFAIVSTEQGGRDRLIGVESVAFEDYTLRLDGRNNAVLAGDDRFEAVEDRPLSIRVEDLLANDFDADGDALTVTRVTAMSGGAVDLSGGHVRFTPEVDFSGTASFTYEVVDGAGAVSTATVEVIVAPRPDAPEAVADRVATDEDTALRIEPETLLANDADADGDDLSVVAVGSAQGGAVTRDADGIVFTPEADFAGLASFVYTIDDGTGRTATATVEVEVAPVNDLPEPRDDRLEGVVEDVALEIDVETLLANDVDIDGDDLGIVSVSDALAGTATLTAGGDTILFSPEPDASGPGGFTYAVDDGSGALQTARVTFDIAPRNDAPVANRDVAETDAGATVTGIDVLTNDTDIDGDDLSVISAASENGVATVAEDGTLAFTPDDGFSGTAIVDYQISDGAGGTAEGVVEITVNDVDRIPDRARLVVERSDASYFDAMLDSTGAPALDGATFDAWCVNEDVFIFENTSYAVDLYEPNEAFPGGGQLSGLVDTLDNITWLINNDGALGLTAVETQNVIWSLTNGSPVDSALEERARSEALGTGEGFEAGAGDQALVLANVDEVQPVVLELAYDDFFA